jgi:hypothetical protein
MEVFARLDPYRINRLHHPKHPRSNGDLLEARIGCRRQIGEQKPKFASPAANPCRQSTVMAQLLTIDKEGAFPIPRK